MPRHDLRIKRSESHPEAAIGYITAMTDDGLYQVRFLLEDHSPVLVTLVDGQLVGEVDDELGTMTVYQDYQSILSGERIVNYITPFVTMDKGRMFTKPFFVTEKHPPSSAKGRSKYTRGRGRPKVDRKQSNS